MKYLLDTHTFLWFLREPERLPSRVAVEIEDAGFAVAVSVASLWEIAIKISIGKLALPKPFEELFPQAVPNSGLTLLAIEPRYLNAVSRLPIVIAIHSTAC